MDAELQNLRRELALIDRGPGWWYPEPLRLRATSWTRIRRAAGASWRQIAVELDISAETLRRWTASETRAGFLPVEVIDDIARTTIRDRGPAIVTRAGHRIEGITIEDVIALVRVLG